MTRLCSKSPAESLEEVGYAILAARSPAEAIHISESYAGPIHLMVTDVIMPGMSGAQLASHLSRLRPEMKVTLCFRLHR